jgi:uroporphyrinogen-III synthase
MRVLVTRPEASTDTTLRRLALAGHEALSLPMTRAEHFPDGVPVAFDHPAEGATADSPAPALQRALVATSAEVFRALHHWPKALAWAKHWPLYGVGPVTAEAASDAGFQEIRMGPGDGAGLARLVVSDYGVRHAGLIYLAGLPRAPDFERIVAEAGVPLETHLVYRMAAVHRRSGALVAAVRAFAPDVVLFYSREAVRLFFADISPADLGDHVRIACLAGRIAAAVPPGCRHVEVASDPDVTALLHLLQD